MKQLITLPILQSSSLKTSSSDQLWVLDWRTLVLVRPVQHTLQAGQLTALCTYTGGYWVLGKRGSQGKEGEGIAHQEHPAGI